MFCPLEEETVMVLIAASHESENPDDCVGEITGISDNFNELSRVKIHARGV
jgi:hypothetical protein